MRTAHPAGPIVTLPFSHLFVHLSQSGEAWKRVNGGSWQYGRFQVSCFICLLAAKGSKTLPVLSTIRGTGLVTQAQYRKTSPSSTGMARNRRLATNKPRSEIEKLHWCYSTLCPISELHDPVDSQSQLECISPPVGRPMYRLYDEIEGSTGSRAPQKPNMDTRARSARVSIGF